MMPLKRNSWSFQFTETALFHFLPLKARISFLSSLSDRYLATLQSSKKQEEEKHFLGYETSWTDHLNADNKVGVISGKTGKKTRR